MTGKIKILIVDDNAVTTEMLGRLLNKENIIEIAANGEDCLAKAPIFSPDIILLDLMLPDISGYDVCRSLRNPLNRRRPTIIVVSARSTRKDKLQAYQAGADDYIVKPFFNEELMAKINAYSKLKRIENANDTRTEFALTLFSQTKNLIHSIETFISLTSHADALSICEQQYLVDITRSRKELITLLEESDDETKNTDRR